MSEKEDLRGAPATIGVVVLTLIFGGVVLAIYPGWGPIGDFLVGNLKLTENAPAWVQAVGSVLAIISAVLIANWQNSKASLKVRKDKIDERVEEWKLYYSLLKMMRQACVKCQENTKARILGKIDRKVSVVAFEHVMDISYVFLKNFKNSDICDDLLALVRINSNILNNIKKKNEEDDWSNIKYKALISYIQKKMLIIEKMESQTESVIKSLNIAYSEFEV